MDFFTHLMFGFLISSWASGNFYNPYVVLGSLLAVLPDFDIFLFPLWRRFPFASHHGITHTALFVVAVSPVIAVIGKFLFWTDLNLPVAAGIMLVTGLMHLGCDALTNWGTPVLYPLSKKYYNLSIDLAVNVYLMLWFFAAVVFLALVRFRYLPFLNMEMASAILGVSYLSYFALRAGSKLYFKRRFKNEFCLLPTEKPWHWRMARRSENEKEIVIGIRNSRGVEEYRIPKFHGERIEVKSCEDLVYTYYLPEVQSHLGVFRFPYYRLNCTNGKWEIIWYVAEMHPRMNLKVDYTDGRFRVRSWW
ncbi:MAG: metal-dependent hydrolase [Thermoplasmata archaeon]|nr:metal-dependent hydrolase [Thermoplasmata archaeon]